MTDYLAVLHGGALDGRSDRVPEGPEGPQLTLVFHAPEVIDFRSLDDPPRPRPAPLTYRLRSATPGEDHAWHYDLEQP